MLKRFCKLNYPLRQLRVFALDRTGFAQPLPAVQLPGGDSAWCFSSDRANVTVLQAEIAQR